MAQYTRNVFEVEAFPVPSGQVIMLTNDPTGGIFTARGNDGDYVGFLADGSVIKITGAELAAEWTLVP